VPFVVTGISQNGDTAALELALKAARLALDAFEVIEPSEGRPSLATGGIVDTGILSGGGLETGTGVPGLTGGGSAGVTSGSRLGHSGPELIAGDSLWDRLADLAIPDDEVENYAETLEAGRTIVAYHATAATVARVETIFRDGGLTKVKTF